MARRMTAALNIFEDKWSLKYVSILQLEQAKAQALEPALNKTTTP